LKIITEEQKHAKQLKKRKNPRKKRKRGLDFDELLDVPPLSLKKRNKNPEKKTFCGLGGTVSNACTSASLPMINIPPLEEFLKSLYKQ